MKKPPPLFHEIHIDDQNASSYLQDLFFSTEYPDVKKISNNNEIIPIDSPNDMRRFDHDQLLEICCWPDEISSCKSGKLSIQASEKNSMHGDLDVTNAITNNSNHNLVLQGSNSEPGNAKFIYNRAVFDVRNSHEYNNCSIDLSEERYRRDMLREPEDVIYEIEFDQEKFRKSFYNMASNSFLSSKVVALRNSVKDNNWRVQFMVKDWILTKLFEQIPIAQDYMKVLEYYDDCVHDFSGIGAALASGIKTYCRDFTNGEIMSFVENSARIRTKSHILQVMCGYDHEQSTFFLYDTKSHFSLESLKSYYYQKIGMKEGQLFLDRLLELSEILVSQPRVLVILLNVAISLREFHIYIPIMAKFSYHMRRKIASESEQKNNNNDDNSDNSEKIEEIGNADDLTPEQKKHEELKQSINRIINSIKTPNDITQNQSQKPKTITTTSKPSSPKIGDPIDQQEYKLLQSKIKAAWEQSVIFLNIICEKYNLKDFLEELEEFLHEANEKNLFHLYRTTHDKLII